MQTQGYLSSTQIVTPKWGTLREPPLREHLPQTRGPGIDTAQVAKIKGTPSPPDEMGDGEGGGGGLKSETPD